MVPPLCYKHNDIHSELINALHFSLPSSGEPLPSPPPAARGDGRERGHQHRDVPPLLEPASDELGEKTRLGLIKVFKYFSTPEQFSN